MKHHKYGVGRANRNHKQLRAVVRASAILCVLLLSIVVPAIGLFTDAGHVLAAGSHAPLFQQATGTPSAAPGTRNTAPAPANTAVTDVAPAPQATGQVPAAPSTRVVPAPGNNGNLIPGTDVTAPTPVASGGFPWWIIPLVVLALAGVAFALARMRRPTVVTVAAAPTLPPSARVSSATSTMSTTPGVATDAAAGMDAGLGAATASITLVEAGVSTAGTLATSPSAQEQVECPNCGTLNSLDENFCHECGQDMRQARAQLLGGVANEPVDEYTPYLETLGRVDEQLEYVLSRPRVTIGSASNNDIVIDSAFRGRATVSQVHAELQRQGDGFAVLDKGSNTGTFVNNTRIAEQPLVDNDQIRVGEVRFVYHAPARS